jgi:hypothetical protein
MMVRDRIGHNHITDRERRNLISYFCYIIKYPQFGEMKDALFYPYPIFLNASGRRAVHVWNGGSVGFIFSLPGIATEY